MVLTHNMGTRVVGRRHTMESRVKLDGMLSVTRTLTYNLSQRGENTDEYKLMMGTARWMVPGVIQNRQIKGFQVYFLFYLR